MGYVKICPLGGIQGAQGPLMQIWDFHIISETTGARKLKLKTGLDVVKYSLRVKYFFLLGGVRAAQGPLV